MPINNMENNLRIARRCYHSLYQALYAFYHLVLHQFIIRHFYISKDKEYVKMCLPGNGRIKQVLVQPPCLYHKPANMVAVYRTAKFLFGNGKADTHRRHFTIARHNPVNELYRKNRIRFPGKEKRMNMLLALEPLVCFKSITNGRVVLVNDYFRRLSSDTVSL